MPAEAWWDGGWASLPAERTRLVSVAARRFNLQVAVSPEHLEETLSRKGWQAVEPADWRWFVKSLNPEPDQENIPLIARSFHGRSEALLMQQDVPGDRRKRTIRFWDSGLRLMPGAQVLYLAQISEERLVTRFGLFSYWRSLALSGDQLPEAKTLFPGLEIRDNGEGLFLVRDPP